MYFIFLFSALFLGINKIICKKLDIRNGIIPYNHLNKNHKWGEILIVVVSIAWLVILPFLIDPPYFFHHLALFLAALFSFRAFMEWKFDKNSKKYILSIIAASYLLIVFLGIELIFTNPIPIRLEAEQVREISVEQYIESEEHYSFSLTDKELFDPILNAISNGSYGLGRWPITPRLEMIIKLENGKEIVIGEFKTMSYKTMSSPGSPTTVFMVHTERILYPRDMIMHSPELERIFNDFAEKIVLTDSD